MTKKVKLLGIQINPVIGDKVKNYLKISKLLKEYEWFKPDLVLLPEVFNSGIDHKKFEDMAEPIPDQTTMFLSGFAQQYNTNIIGGSFIEKSHTGHLKNTSVAFDRTGKILGKYSKIHMFSHLGSSEGEKITSGNTAKIIDMDFGKVGLSICYDLRFPELYRALAYNGAQLIVCPAAWPYPRYDHWMTLLKARAIENLCFMFAVNQCGKVSLSRTNLGQSAIINPWGEIIANAGSQEGVVMAEIDIDEVSKTREDFPVLNDRNLDAYKL